jgi:hypothetical protein
LGLNVISGFTVNVSVFGIVLAGTTCWVCPETVIGLSVIETVTEYVPAGVSGVFLPLLSRHSLGLDGSTAALNPGLLDKTDTAHVAIGPLPSSLG